MYKSQIEYAGHDFKYKFSNNIFSNYFVLYFIYQYCSYNKILNEKELNKWLFDGWNFLIGSMINYSMNDSEKDSIRKILDRKF